MFKLFGRRSQEQKADEKSDDAMLMLEPKGLLRKLLSDSGVHTGRLSDFTEQGAHRIEGKYLPEAIKLAQRQTATELVDRLRAQNSRWLEALLAEDKVTLHEIVTTKRLEDSGVRLGSFTLSSMQAEGVAEILTQKIDVTGQAIEINHLTDVNSRHRSA
jgi:hypothetical protein